MTDEALTDLATLLRRFHEAAASPDLTGISGWARHWADPLGGPVVCHNDVYPENVVFRDGRVVALIDFDMAAPGRALWDVTIAPLHAPEARRDHPFAHIRSEIAGGNPFWAQYWRETHGEDRAAVDDAWLEQQRNALGDAVAGRSLRGP